MKYIGKIKDLKGLGFEKAESGNYQKKKFHINLNLWIDLTSKEASFIGSHINVKEFIEFYKNDILSTGQTDEYYENRYFVVWANNDKIIGAPSINKFPTIEAKYAWEDAMIDNGYYSYAIGYTAANEFYEFANKFLK